jgi:hypothetical protein
MSAVEKGSKPVSIVVDDGPVNFGPNIILNGPLTKRAQKGNDVPMVTATKTYIRKKIQGGWNDTAKVLSWIALCQILSYP